MRPIPSELKRILEKKHNVHADRTDIKSSIWINRPVTALVNDVFLEKQRIKTLSSSAITSMGIAVSHPKRGHYSPGYYISYIEGGNAKVIYADSKTKIDSHLWMELSYNKPASKVDVTFDGYMPMNARNESEFVTVGDPYVTRIHNGTVYSGRIGEDEEIIFENNATDISVVRATWSQGFDFGMIVFAILNGSLFYRQLIDDIWYDAIDTGWKPDNVTWKEVTASRTWDYRVALQVKATNNDVYERYTQFMGIAKHTTERLELSKLDIKSKLIGLTYRDRVVRENLQLSGLDINSGLWSILPTEILSIENINDGYGDWGTIVKIIFNNHIDSSTLVGNTNKFKLVDSRGIEFLGNGLELSSDMKTLYLTGIDFNNARELVTMSYIGGSIKTMAGLDVGDLTTTFTPVNLEPSEIPVPKVEAIWNE